MIEKNENLEKAEGNLYNALKNVEYNKGFSWNEFKIMAKINLTTPQLYYVLGKVNDTLMANNNRCLKNIRSYGKRILNPKEHCVEAKRTVKRSVNIYKKAGKIINATNLDQLNEDEKKSVYEDARRYRTLEFFAQECLKVKKLEKKEEAKRLIGNVMELFIEKNNDE